MTKPVKYILLVVFLCLCVIIRWNLKSKSENNEPLESNESGDTIRPKIATKHAEYFKLYTYDVKWVETAVVNLNKDREYIQSFNFTPKTGLKYDLEYLNKKNTVVCLSSVYIGYLAALGLEDKIVGVDNLDFISNVNVKNNNSIVEVGNVGQLNMEALIALNPKYVFIDDFELNEKLSEALLEAGILLVRCNAFREKTPLARAEWIKFFGVLFNEYDRACTLFEDSKLKYHLLKKEAESYTFKPTVFLNAPYGDQWTIPGGKSFQAQLIKDAGGKYVFEQDTNPRVIFTGFEQMLTTAKNADFWLHTGIYSTKKELLQSNPNYSKFEAFKNGKLFNNNKNTNEDGGIPYWETAGVYPEFVLEDLIRIFYPSSSQDYKFHYYQKLK